jgi:hypothetical protein
MENKMTENDRCQNLIALQNSRLERFDNTRKIQWNFNGIFWTGIIVSVSFFIKEKIYFDWVKLTSVFIPLLVVHGLTICLIQKSLDYDKSAVDRYRIPAENLLGLEPEKTTDRRRVWFWIQISITILILLFSFYILKA